MAWIIVMFSAVWSFILTAPILFCTDEEINSSTSKMQICTQMFTFGWNIPLTAFCFQFFLVFQMGILISAGFIVSWAPYVFVSLWTMFHSDGKDSVAPIVSLLPCLFAKCSTVYNPLVYYVFRKSFRRELRQIRMYCCWDAVSKMALCIGTESSEETSRAQETAEEWTHTT